MRRAALIWRVLYLPVEGACIAAVLVFTPVWLPALVIYSFCSRCPACRTRWMRATGGIRRSYPENEATGTSYLCRRCHREWWWSDRDRHYSPYDRKHDRAKDDIA